MKSKSNKLLWQYVISGFLLCNAIILFTFVLHLSKGEPLSIIYQLKNNPSFFTVCFTSFIIIPVFFIFGKGRLYLIKINEKIKAGEEVKEQLLSELSDYKFALDQTAMVMVVDGSGKIKRVNDNFLSFTGYKPESVLGKSIIRLPSSLQNRELLKHIKQSLASGSVWRGGIEYYNSGDKVSYTNGTVIPLSQKDSASGDCLIIQYDITAEKNAEMALRKSEYDKNIILSNTQAIICTHSLDGRLTSINKAGSDLLKLSQAELIGMSLEAFIDDKFSKEYHEYLCLIKAQGFAEGFMKIADSKGRKRTFFYRNVVSSRHHEQFVIGSAIDITETLEAQREVESQRVFQRQILDVSPNLICVTDKNGVLILGNKKFKSIFGSHVEGKLVSDFNDDLRTKLLGLINPSDSSLAPASGNYEWSLNEADNTRKHFSVYRTRFSKNTGIEYTLVIGTDISEKHEAQVQLEKAHALVAKSLKVKEQFIANMSHEIRTPLNAIIGFTDLLTDSPLDVRQKDYVQTVKIAGQNLLNIINDILDLSKIEAGVISIEKKAMNIREMVGNTKKLFEPKVIEKSIYLNVDISKDVPCFVSGDPGRLNQVLINLVGNAVKFTRNGGVSVAVNKVDGADDNKAYLRFDIKDTGIGIASDKKRVIFDRFEQESHDTHKIFGGTGLGLNIAKNLVELFGGKIEVQSEPGLGSTFSFIVPFDIATAEAIKDVYNDQAGPELQFKRPVKILLAEDNLTNAKLAKQLLGKNGFSVHHVQDGMEAIKMLDENRYDLILMDIQMAGMGGLEATQMIRSSAKPYSGIPIIALTAHSFTGERNVCSQAGMNAYISKPFSPPQLFGAINKILAGKEVDLIIEALA